MQTINDRIESTPKQARLNCLVDAAGRYRSRILPIGELLGVVLPHMIKDGGDLAFLVSGEGGHLRPPSGGDAEGLAGGHEDRRGELTGEVLLERILLHGQVAEEVGILLDVAGNLFDEVPALPGIVDEDGALGEVVAHNVEGGDGPEGPVEMLEDLDLPIAEGEGRHVGLATLAGELGHLEQLGNDRTVLLGLLVLGCDGDAGRGKELPLVALHLGVSKYLVHEHNGHVDGGVVQMILLSDIAHPIDEVAAVGEVVRLGVEGLRSHKVSLSLEHILINVLRRYTEILIDI
mmetsp:Transcript_34634/g.101802  ORF Transcript_34634/g.101802 Transcript_34634/m.101802 type:complete len:290 (+) Transcript_34634:1597-2466(+)